MPQLVYIGLGSNLGYPQGMLRNALSRIAHVGHLQQVSRVYISQPWGVLEPQPPYYNLVAALKTNNTPRLLLTELQIIEQELGRQRVCAKSNSPRVIDLDILLYGDAVLSTRDGQLTIPHPRMSVRPFVLAPLADIAVSAIHPLLHLTVGEMLESVGNDGVQQIKFTQTFQ